jgi:sodium/bile acid cotransporter 7
MSTLSRFRPDQFTIAMLATVVLSLLLPCRGASAAVFEWLTGGAIALLFFLQGARLSRGAILAGALHWRLHLLVFTATFVLFPIVGLMLRPLSGTLLTPPLYLGLLFLCTLPSTVQASVAFTSIAGGNVAAALCSASASSIIGVFLTPLLASFALKTFGGFSLGALWSIGTEMLFPFIFGHLLQPRIGRWVMQRRKALGWVDRGSVLLVVYTVFSGATLGGVWHQLALRPMAILFAVSAALLALMLAITAVAARGLGFSRQDEIAIMFCGSKKSLVTGIPMANVLFAGQSLGLIVLPLMIFHQIQLMACAALARRYASGSSRRAASVSSSSSAFTSLRSGVSKPSVNQP